MSDLLIEQVTIGPMANYAYLVGDAAERKLAVIDPGWDAERIFAACDRLGGSLEAIMLTHTHFDHVDAIADILKKREMPVYVHQAEASLLHVDKKYLHPVEDGDSITVGEVKFTVIHTPGHSVGSVCYAIDKALFTGDTLFVGACGRWDLPGGDIQKLATSLTVTLAALDDESIIYPGHDYGGQPTATLAQQKQTNPYLNPATFEKYSG